MTAEFVSEWDKSSSGINGRTELREANPLMDGTLRAYLFRNVGQGLGSLHAQLWRFHAKRLVSTQPIGSCRATVRSSKSNRFAGSYSRKLKLKCLRCFPMQSDTTSLATASGFMRGKIPQKRVITKGNRLKASPLE